MVGFVGPQARVLPVSFYVGNQATFHLSTTRNPNQSWDQPCILHIPGIIRTEKAALTFSISILHLLTFSYLLKSITTTIPPVQRTWKNFCQILDHGKIATRLTPTRALLMFCDPTIVKDPTPAMASLFDLQGLQKNFLSNHALWSPACVDTYAISRSPVSPCNTFAHFTTSPLNHLSQTPFIQLGFVSFWVSPQNSSLWCFEPNMSKFSVLQFSAHTQFSIPSLRFRQKI